MTDEDSAIAKPQPAVSKPRVSSEPPKLVSSVLLTLIISRKLYARLHRRALVKVASMSCALPRRPIAFARALTSSPCFSRNKHHRFNITTVPHAAVGVPRPIPLLVHVARMTCQEALLLILLLQACSCLVAQDVQAAGETNTSSTLAVRAFRRLAKPSLHQLVALVISALQMKTTL